ncbi:hypothetical protein LXL04_013040 [Taraxacum kok-saghyz]
MAASLPWLLVMGFHRFVGVGIVPAHLLFRRLHCFTADFLLFLCGAAGLHMRPIVAAFEEVGDSEEVYGVEEIDGFQTEEAGVDQKSEKKSPWLLLATTRSGFCEAPCELRPAVKCERRSSAGGRRRRLVKQVTLGGFFTKRPRLNVDENVGGSFQTPFTNNSIPSASNAIPQGKHLSYHLVYRLLKLVLILPVATASVERCFSKMKIVKSDLRNKIGDEFLNNALLSLSLPLNKFALNKQVLQDYTIYKDAVFEVSTREVVRFVDMCKVPNCIILAGFLRGKCKISYLRNNRQESKLQDSVCYVLIGSQLVLRERGISLEILIIGPTCRIPALFFSLMMPDTRSAIQRLEEHDAQLTEIQSDISSMKSNISAIHVSLAKQEKDADDFHILMLQWMQKMERMTSKNGGDTSGSGVSGPQFSPTHASVPPTPIQVTPVPSGGMIPPPAAPSSGGFPWSVKKVKLPEFHGFDPQGWIQKADLYFDINEVTPDLRMRLAQLSMTGVAQHWFTIVKQLHSNISWEEFQRELLQRFSGLEIQNPYEQLATLKQTSTIYDYIDDFEYLLSLIPQLPESQSLGYFIAGLGDDVKKWVRLHRPKSRLDAMYLAKDVEEMLRPSSHVGSQNRFRYQPSGGSGMGCKPDFRPSSLTRSDFKGGGFTKPNFSRADTLRPTVPPKPISPNIPEPFTPRERGMRSLSRTEWEDRRKKGLCFRCGQQFGPAHKCPEGKLRILLLGDDEEEGDNMVLQLTDDIPAPIEDDLPVGSCSVLERFGSHTEITSGGKMLKLEGAIGDIPIVILVDSGASHNFVSKQLITYLGIPFTEFAGIHIKLGDGHNVFIQHRSHRTTARIGEFYGLFSSLAPMASYASPSPRPKSSNPISSDPSPSELTDEQQRDLHSLLAQFMAVFAEPTSLPPSRTHDHSISLLSPHAPICVRPYRYPHIQKTEIERQVQELLSLGMIRPSKSAFSSPVILVRKKDLSWRMCVDYRALNKATVPDKYPIPMVDELLDELHGARYFSKLDLKSGYNQIRMQPESIEKTAFRIHDGHYEYLVMPFGLTNAPATFQAVMNDIFRPFLRKMIVVFFDDILIYSPTWSAHLKDLEMALQTLLQHQFMVNKKKCYFGQSSVEYLGHIITGHGVAMDPQKIEAVLAWPTPRQIKGLRGFLGLTGYYRKFVRHYGSIAKPLTDLTKKDAFMWTSEAQLAFDKLKEALVTAPVLGLPDFSLPFIVECDASGRGIGAVLMQNKKPIAYFSKALSERNLVKSAYEREIMALVLSVQHWRSYLLGTRFTVYTDQKSLKFLLQQRITSPDQQNWVAKLLGYTFDICYKPGRENRAADALSRRAEEGELQLGVSAPIWVQGAQLLEEVRGDKDIALLIQQCLDRPTTLPKYSVRQGLLYYRNRLVISRNSKFIPGLLKEFHQSAAGGHSGYYRTYRRLAVNLYWPSMIKRVKAFVRECDICQRCKASTAAPSGLLQPWQFPSIFGNTYPWILYWAKSIAEIFVKEVIRHHGVPKSIVSDRDPLFLSRFWQEIFKSQGTELHMSSAYHPESDGQTEVINRCLETYLRCFAVDQPRTWSLWILWAEFWYNSTFHSTTGKTPFEIVYGRPAPSVVQFVPGEVRVDAVITELLDRDEVLRQLKVQLSRAQTTMKENADKKRRDVQFMTGEWVYVKLKPYRQMSVTSRVHQKLAARFFGPFQIVAKIGPVAYKLDLPPTSRIHPVFHVSLLKKAVQTVVEQGLPPELETDENDLVLPVAILKRRTVGNQDVEVEQWLVQWSGGTTEEATWEDRTTIENQFPDTSLEDKTFSEGVSTDEDPVLLSPNVPKPRILQFSSLGLMVLLDSGCDKLVSFLALQISLRRSTRYTDFLFSSSASFGSNRLKSSIFPKFLISYDLEQAFTGQESEFWRRLPSTEEWERSQQPLQVTIGRMGAVKGTLLVPFMAYYDFSYFSNMGFSRKAVLSFHQATFRNPSTIKTINTSNLFHKNRGSKVKPNPILLYPSKQEHHQVVHRGQLNG